MNWEAFGAIAEACGALAVIFTLVYLSIQIRQSNKLIRHNLAESHMNATNEISKVLATEPEVANIFWEGLQQSRDSLTVEQRRQYDALLFIFMNSGYQAFRQEDEEGLRRSQWILPFPGFRDWWVEYSDTYAREFGDYVNQALADLAER